MEASPQQAWPESVRLSMSPLQPARCGEPRAENDEDYFACPHTVSLTPGKEGGQARRVRISELFGGQTRPLAGKNLLLPAVKEKKIWRG